ncbi:MAG: alpha/beta fold hydrolase [Alphaproteobacteria bacterium]|nr:alpha/beta fold hydrolase [Alphaproteobacteria bacterium]
MKPEQPSEAEAVPVALPVGTVGVVDEGTGPTVVAIHGLPGSVRDWRWLAPALTPHVRFVRLDLPGFGKTPPGDVGYDIDARGAWVAAVLEGLGLEDAVLLGHSMGGPVAASAARQSDRVRALGLVASVGTEIHVMLRRQPGVRWACYTLHAPPVARAMLPYLRRNFERTGFRNVSDDEILQACFVLARVRFGTNRANLAALRKPTLVAWASDDKLVDEPVSEKLYWAAPIGPRIRFPTGGHNIQATRASELAEALLAWIPQLG